MHNVDLQEWLNNGLGTRDFREAVHVVLMAFSTQVELANSSYMKGGILMTLAHGSPRYTNDIDFSTTGPHAEATQAMIIDKLQNGLAQANETLGYPIQCKLQKYDVNPKSPGSTWQTLTIKVAYAKPDTSAYKRMLNLQCPHVVTIDYSFSEDVPGTDVIAIGDAYIQTYSTELLIAEKYRALLQQPSRDRVRRQDVYDIAYLLDLKDFTLEQKALIHDFLISKSASRKVYPEAISLRIPEVRERAQRHYPTLADEVPELPDFDKIYRKIQDFYESMPWQ